MIGRGAANDKGGVAMMLAAINVLEKAGVHLKGDLIAMSSLGGRDYGEGDSCWTLRVRPQRIPSRRRGSTHICTKDRRGCQRS